MSIYYEDDGKEYAFSDPKKVGPGLWMSFLIHCATSDTRPERFSTCLHMRKVIARMGCEECRSHSATRLSNDPPETHMSTSRELFDWIVDFMNSINERNGKKLYKSEILWRRFTSESSTRVCESCGSNKRETIPVAAPSLTRKLSITLPRSGKK